MLLGHKKEPPKDKGGLSSGYTGKTARLLREAQKEQAAKAPKRDIVLHDGEDRAACVLNDATWVQRAQLDEPMVATRLVEAAQVQVNPLPDMSRFKTRPEPATLMALISSHQEGVMQDMLQREAGREALRRMLLLGEKVEWRAAQMQATFDQERTDAHERMKRTVADFARVRGEYEARFAREAAATARVGLATANRDRALAGEAAKWSDPA